MKNISVTYKSLFRHKTIAASVPATWAELSPKQLITVSKLMLNEGTQTEVVASLINIPEKVVRKFNPVEMYWILQEFEFLKDFRPRNSFIMRLKGLFPPQNKLNKMTWAQFVFIESYLDEYNELNSDTAAISDACLHTLDLFVSHLYLRQSENFNHEVCAARASQQIIKSIDLHTKIAILINYRLVREWLSSSYPLVFSKRHDAETQPTERHKKVKNPWIEVYDAIVSDDILNYDKYGEIELHVVLKYLKNKIKKNARS